MAGENANPFKKASEERKKTQDKIINDVKKDSNETKKDVKRDDAIKEIKSNDEVKKQRVVRNKSNSIKDDRFKKISINVPNEHIEMIQVYVGIKYKGKLTRYINELIERDIKRNKKYYDELNQIL